MSSFSTTFHRSPRGHGNRKLAPLRGRVSSAPVALTFVACSKFLSVIVLALADCPPRSRKVDLLAMTSGLSSTKSPGVHLHSETRTAEITLFLLLTKPRHTQSTRTRSSVGRRPANHQTCSGTFGRGVRLSLAVPSVSQPQQPPPFRAPGNNSQTHNFHLGRAYGLQQADDSRRSRVCDVPVVSSTKGTTARRELASHMTCRVFTRSPHTHLRRLPRPSLVLFGELRCSGRDDWELEEREGERREGRALKLSWPFPGLL